MKVKGTCEIYILDQSKVARLEYKPSPDKVLPHELCHCNDYHDVLLNIMQERYGATYPNKARCEDARAAYDKTFMDRFRNSLPGHRDPKYKAGGDCFAEWVLQ
jgi:hypothetical protein